MVDPPRPEDVTAKCDPPTPIAEDRTLPGEQPGQTFGPYRIVERLGAGGFGTVFEAEQSHPVRRRVALKVIKLGMDTRELIARFEAERQALALMDHPHIARVLDAGATESGRPYFVMELVAGRSITSYCDENRLGIVERLELFDQVCQAVQHAHTKGVIHRDLKPSNVLVSTQDERPFAKVIDFGIAKATSGRLTDRSLLTQQHQLIGTPLYMSPEQAEGSADIDTRADIYALGVLLYELLTGTTPFEWDTLRSAGYAEVQRIIREVEPPRPSARLAQSGDSLDGAARHCRMDPRKLTRTIRGELDWIVMKAIDKERSRRYDTASALSLDVRRFLSGQSVLAAPPSTLYRLRKFARRHRRAVAAGALVAVALVLGMIGFARQARIAELRAAELEQVAKFQAEMLRQVNPAEAGKLLIDDTTARLDEALAKSGVSDADRAARRDAFAREWREVNATDTARTLIDRTLLRPAIGAIDRGFKDQPIVDAALRQGLADRYREMGLYDAALPLQERALADRRRALGVEHPDTLASINAMGELLRRQGKRAEAEPFLRDALDRRTRVLGAEHPDTLRSINNLGVLLWNQGRHAEAEALLRDALDKSRRVLGADDPATIDTLSNLGLLLRAQGKLDAAEPLYRETLEKRRRVLGEEHPDTLGAINNIASLLENQGRLDAAEPYYREVLDKSRRVLGQDHPDTLIFLNNLAFLELRQGKLDAAEAHYAESVEKRTRLLGAEHPRTLISLAGLGALRVAQGRHAEARDLLAAAAPAARRAFTGANAYRLATLLTTLGRARTALGETTAAEADLEQARRILAETPGPYPQDARDNADALAALRNRNWTRSD